eukprot:CAMPEP_0181135426 /NCGR_PEP_ID=MMETSP1071-20121207/32624_1 /TAXON_ID=35127 /ORGANISM="Thalassiosira sp., Strain NH16" /LENGTH=479 /DNA_ID=CAMNT_0023222029 /DNA_START=166 /DNA_END=1605 /DNA_ORIENTATION=+
MGWYGGQDGAARLRWYDQSKAAYNRFRGSVSGAKLTSFYNRVEDNRDRNTSNMLVRNAMSQDDLVKAVLLEAEQVDDGSGWAVVIAASEDLHDLSLLDDVAGRITGLFLYGCHKLDRTKMEAFFSKLVNLESLTLDSCSPLDMYREDGIFLKTVFSGGMLPKLKFLETDAATDDAIAEMSTCPDLVKITFVYPSLDITNEGIQRLVDAGGGQELMNVSAGTLKKHLSKALTMKYVAATLPKLVNLPEHQAHQYLSHMVKGAKKKSALERLQAKHYTEDSKPFAVVPPERMTYEQLAIALKRRGVPHKKAKKYTEEMRSMFVDGQVKWTYDQELDFQNVAKLEHLQEELEKLRKHAATADGVVVKLSSGSLGRNVSKLYPLFGVYQIESALRETKVHIPRDASKRRDERAQLLHNSGYQGGGDIDNQLVHYRKVSAERNEKVAEKEGEIQTLRQEMELKDAAGGSLKAITNGKRDFQTMS